ncbi:hypothetical protein ACFYN3_34555 [Streptomyces lavendulae]|uniref:hypothetical protein n=1 Tax=Streptomyces lavendulae TaxID=1914 RepID=UPI0036AFD214
MPSPTGAWSLRRLASEAGVLPKVARDAAAEGVIDPMVLVESDILLVRLYGALKRHVWPEERRPANKDQGLRLWEQMAIDTVRGATPEELGPATGLFIHQTGAQLANGPGEYCTELFRLQDKPFYYAPIGKWFRELPSQRPDSGPSAG